jgi:membrane protease YdiL (CAAX protease family)
VGVKEFARRLVHWPTRWTWFALLAFPVFQVVPAAIMGVLKQPLVWPSQHGPIAVLVACGLLFFAYNVVFVGAEEEPGWRGFLLDRLQGRFSPLVASLLVWLPWALWHGPLDYFRPVRFTLVFWLLLRVVTLIPLTIIITWFYNRSGRSIQATVMFHASMNTAPMVLPYSQTAMALLFVWAAWVVIAGRMWRKNSEIRGQGLLPLNPDI